MIRAAAYVMTILLRISDVIGCASTEFYVERGSGSATKALDFVSDLAFSAFPLVNATTSIYKFTTVST